MGSSDLGPIPTREQPGAAHHTSHLQCEVFHCNARLSEAVRMALGMSPSPLAGRAELCLDVEMSSPPGIRWRSARPLAD